MPEPAIQPSAPASTPRFSNVALVAIGSFFYWAAMYLYAAILPVYALSLGASLSIVGVIVATYALPQLLLRIPLGLWSDKMGRRKPLILGGVLTVFLAAVMLMSARQPWQVVVARGAAGVGAAMWVIISVYFVSLFPEGKERKAFSMLYVMSNGALVVATLLGGMMADYYGVASTFYGAAALAIVSVIAMWLSRETKLPQHSPMTLGGFTRVVSSPVLVAASVMGILLMFVQFSGVLGFTPVFAHSIGASKTEIGVVTMLAMAAAVVGAVTMSPVVSRLGYSRTIILTSALLGVATLAVPFADSVRLLYGLQLANGFARGVAFTAITALSIHGIAPEQRATALGIFQSAYAIGMIVGPLLSGLLADSFGLASVFYLSGMLSVVIAGTATMRVVRHVTG